MRNKRPIIAITMGDPAGIGPEIIIKALANPLVYQICSPLVIGDSKILKRVIRILNAELKILSLSDPKQGKYCLGEVDCLDLDLVPGSLEFGEISEIAGNAAFQFLKKGIELALGKRVAAICTAPLNKASLNLAGHAYAGHTEILAKFTGVRDYAMMLTSPKLKVIHVTTHLGLVEAIEKIEPERVYQVIVLAWQALRNMGIGEPKIAVSAINPHAGEGGLFGRGEEEEKIIPAIERAKARGIKACGPLPADTVFYQAVQGDYDLVVAMYHDQGHIPLKILGFEWGVNITVGLPFVRTSVDHGTAFDIAGQGVASEKSLLAALQQAARSVPRTT